MVNHDKYVGRLVQDLMRHDVGRNEQVWSGLGRHCQLPSSSQFGSFGTFTTVQVVELLLQLEWKWIITKHLADDLRHGGTLRMLERTVKAVKLHARQFLGPCVSLPCWNQVGTGIVVR